MEIRPSTPAPAVTVLVVFGRSIMPCEPTQAQRRQFLPDCNFDNYLA